VVLSEAVARARRGDGPTLVEADTYRIHAHTNADDPSRYRTDDEVDEWRPRDPLQRLRAHLIATGTLTPQLESEFAAAAEEMAAHVRAGMGEETALDPAELFAHVYSKPTPQLREQAAQLAAELNEVRS
jgi:pyruvate dehydrogenase E1 component alpha subunit